MYFWRMHLKTYLLSIPMSERERLARACGTSYAHLRNVAYGSRTCGESLAINVDRETGGKVPCEALRPDVDWAYLRSTSTHVAQETA